MATRNGFEPVRLENVPMTWAFDCNFPEHLRDEVRAGFDYWNTVIEKKLFLEAPSCGMIDPSMGVVVYMSSRDYDPKEEEQTVAATVRWVGDKGIRGGTVVIYRNWLFETPEIRISTVRHEAGHALGYRHSVRAKCLMYPYVNAGGGPGPKDLCQEERLLLELAYGSKRR